MSRGRAESHGSSFSPPSPGLGATDLTAYRRDAGPHCKETGPTLDPSVVALRTATQDERFRTMSIGERNPSRSAGDPAAIPVSLQAVASVTGAPHGSSG